MRPALAGLLALVATALCGCGGDGVDASPAPSLGPQIERMGRSGINTVVTDPFFRESVPEEQARHNLNVDNYDAEDDLADSATRFLHPLADTLAIFDALDQDCGNQLLANEPGPNRYGLLALVLARDALYINTASGTCELYLAVELNSVDRVDSNDCGGRTPIIDPIDATYSLAATGELSGVDDGLPADIDGQHSVSQFPFLDPAI